MYFLSWNLIPRETCQALVTREGEYVKWEKETQSRKVLANGYRLDGFLALRWGLAPYAVHRLTLQSAEFAGPHFRLLTNPTAAVPPLKHQGPWALPTPLAVPVAISHVV